MMVHSKLLTLLRYLAICLVCLVHSSLANAQGSVTFISSVTVNGEKLQPQEQNNLIVATDDVVIFSYTVTPSAPADKTVRYEIEFNNGKENYSINTAETSQTYNNLQSGEYTLRVQAKDNATGWQTTPALLRFSVNTQKALQARAEKRRKMEQANVVQQPQPEQSGMQWYLVAAIGLGAFLLGAGTMFILRKNTEVPLVFAETPVAQAAVREIPKRDSSFEKEINQLKAEIDLLKTQLQRVREHNVFLEERNNELSMQVERLSSKKSELESLQQQKDDFFAMMIHDIKNPAALIKGLVELLRNYDKNSSDSQEIIDDIIVTTSKIVHLSQEFSKVLALDSSSLSLDLFTANIVEVIQSVCRRNAVAGDAKGIKIFVEVPNDLPPLNFDPQKMEEVYDNLISNAIKFSLPGSYVTVRAAVKDSMLITEVEDKGLGMSADDISKAFQRGVRLTAKPTSGEPSSGLGLWIVKRIVEAHNGSVSITSTVGKGSTFSIQLPISKDIPL